MSQNPGFATEQIAREKAAAEMPNKTVYIIQSNGQFYVESDQDGGFLRSWEREVFHGLGRNALMQRAGARS